MIHNVESKIHELKMKIDMTCFKKKEVTTGHVTNYKVGTVNIRPLFQLVFALLTCLHANAGIFDKNLTQP